MQRRNPAGRRRRVHRRRMPVICLMLSIPAIEACDSLFAHDVPPPPERRPPPRIWTVEGSRRGSDVQLSFMENGEVRQHLDGKHAEPNLIEGFISPGEGSEPRVPVEFVRDSTAPGAEEG